MKVIVFAAHPDDETLGCGGTIARLAAEGHEVHVAIVAEGVTGRYADRSAADKASLTDLHARSRRAAELLGAKSWTMLGLPDQRLDTLPLLEIVRSFEALVDAVRPEVVYTHHGGDLNLDHATVFRAALTAVRPTPPCGVREVLAFEVPSSTEWAFHQVGTPFHPNLFVDVSATLDLKLRALDLYAPEMRAAPHPRSTEMVRANAQRWGSVVGRAAAEAFVIVRSVR